MTFWSVFWACAIAIVIGNIAGLLIGMGAGYLKRRANKRKIEQEYRVAQAMGTEGEEKGLQRCPFCGHSNLDVAQSTHKVEGSPRGHFSVVCLSCGAFGPLCHHPEEAETAWNRSGDVIV